MWWKRVLFVAALPLSILFMVMLGAGLVRTCVRWIRDRFRFSVDVFVAAMACTGFGLFVYWQGHSGLLPGKNSTIKFMYFAYVVPFAIATAFGRRFRERAFHWLVAYNLLVFALSLPIAIADAAWLAPAYR